MRFSLFKALDEIGEVTAASRQLEAANAVKEEIMLAGAMSQDSAGGGQAGVMREMQETGEGAQPVWASKATAQLLFALLHTFPSEGAMDDDSEVRNVASGTSVCERTDEEGATLTAPVMIVGLPRSGSTLVQQMLAIHPAIIQVTAPNKPSRVSN